MNKAEFISAVAEEAGSSKSDASAHVEAMINVVTKTLKGDAEVALVGFGTFKAKKRDARQGRNPRTGETIQIAASTVPAFKAGKAFKDALN
jgi:DNA-binding protein HU-beta